MTERPSALEASDRALVLYALVRRAAIELVLAEHDDTRRYEQAEAARAETDRWLERESLREAPTDTERMLLGAPSGSWTGEAIADGLWRKEALGALLWALGHLEALPPIEREFSVPELNERLETLGSVSSFRARGRLRDDPELAAAWEEASGWSSAAAGNGHDDATLASISAERSRALAWLRDRSAPPP